MAEKECPGQFPEKYPTSGLESTIKIPGSGNFTTRMDPPAEEFDNHETMEALRLLVNKESNGHYLPLLLAADGIGPPGNGDIASHKFRKLLRESIQIHPSDKPDKIIGHLIETFESSAARIREEALAEKKRMGCSAMSLLVVNGILYYTWAGNIRAYLYGKDVTNQDRIPDKEPRSAGLLKSLFNKIIPAPLSLIRLTDDHSYAFQMWKEGKITEDDFKDFPNRKFATRAIGITDDLHCDAGMLRLDPDDILLVLSDGVHHMLNAARIQQIIETTLNNPLEDIKSTHAKVLRTIMNEARSIDKKEYMSGAIYSLNKQASETE